MSQSPLRYQIKQLAQRVFPGSTVLRAWPLKGGISARMTGIEVQLPDGHMGKIVLRRLGEWALEKHLHLASVGFQTLNLVRRFDIGAAEPLYFDQTGEVFPDPYFVTEYIEGAPDHSPSDVIRCANRMAGQLARIHSVNPADRDLSLLPSQAARCRDSFKKLPSKINEKLGERDVREALAKVWPLPALNPPVLLHGDFWPGNLIWREGEIVGVIDWEESEVGDPLSDLAISRLDVFWAYGEAAMQELTATYATTTGRDMSQMPYWDLWAALRPMQNIAVWAAGSADIGREDMTEESMSAGLRWFIGQALDALEPERNSSRDS